MFIKKILFLLFPLFLFGEVVADTVYLISDAWDAYTWGTDEVIDRDLVKFANGGPFKFDGYWGFSITSDIYSRQNDSIKIRLYIDTDGDDAICYGLQQEDCGEIESIDLSEITRTTASANVQNFVKGVWLSGDIKSTFNEWVSDYSHSGTDHFGMVFDDNGNANRNDAYDYSNGDYDADTYLIFYYEEVAVSGQVIIPQMR